MKITDERYPWLNKRKHFDKYGRFECGQQVNHQRLIYAPTNSAKRLHVFSRDETGQIVDGDPTFTVETQHTIIDIRDSDCGAFLVLVDGDGLLSVELTNAYGQAGFGFFRVLRATPRQRELAV